MPIGNFGMTSDEIMSGVPSLADVYMKSVNTAGALQEMKAKQAESERLSRVDKIWQDTPGDFYARAEAVIPHLRPAEAMTLAETVRKKRAEEATLAGAQEAARQSVPEVTVDQVSKVMPTMQGYQPEGPTQGESPMTPLSASSQGWDVLDNANAAANALRAKRVAMAAGAPSESLKQALELEYNTALAKAGANKKYQILQAGGKFYRYDPSSGEVPQEVGAYDVVSKAGGDFEALLSKLDISEEEKNKLREERARKVASFAPTQLMRMQQDMGKLEEIKKSRPLTPREKNAYDAMSRELGAKGYKQVTVPMADGTPSFQWVAPGESIEVARGEIPTTTPALREKALESQVANQDLIFSTLVLAKETRPEYFDYAKQYENTYQKYKDKILGGDYSDLSGIGTEDYWSWRGAVGRTFDVYRKQITGAQAADAELTRLENNFVSAGMSAPQFSGALQAINAIARAKLELDDIRASGKKASQKQLEALADKVSRYKKEFRDILSGKIASTSPATVAPTSDWEY